MSRIANFTFDDSGLNRAAELRDDAAHLAALLQDGGQVLPFWRGKPLVVDGMQLGWVPHGHPALAHGGALVFLGLDDGVARFAQDISDWSPEANCSPAEGAVGAGFFDASAQYHPSLPQSHAFAEMRGIMVQFSLREAELLAEAKAVLHWHKSHGFCAVCGHASEITNGGWRRVCAACGSQHFPRTDPVVIMLITRGNSVLMGRSPGWPEGMYSCLAGFVEPGETIEAAVRREVAEETGIAVGNVRYIACQPWPFPASLMMGLEGEALNDDITIGPAELEDAIWVTREDMAASVTGERPGLRPARKGSIAHFLIFNWLADRLK